MTECDANLSLYQTEVALGIWCANWEMGCEALGIDGHFAVLSAGERGVEDAHAKLRLYKKKIFV